MIHTAVTLWQPRASLVVLGKKRIETRSWSTSFRGMLLIHAAKSLRPVGGPDGLDEMCCVEPFFSALYSAGLKRTDDLPLGAIIGSVRLVDCVPITRRPAYDHRVGYAHVMTWRLPPDEPELSLGDFSTEPRQRYAWLLADPRAFATPIPATGHQRLWHWKGVLP